MTSSTAGDGDDTIYGQEGDDFLNGGDDNDMLIGGAGDDTIDGGRGAKDTVSFAASLGAISLALKLDDYGVATGEGTDKIRNVENIIGSSFGDTLTGDSANNTFEGGGGNDILDGDGGSDNTASYASASAGVMVNLALTTQQDTVGAGLDTLSNFQNLIGSSHNDTLTGTSSANVIEAGDGDDLIMAGAGADKIYSGDGADTLDGGLGADTMVGGAGDDIYYVDNLSDTVAETSNGGIDSVFSSVSYALWEHSQFIENLTLTGTANINASGNGMANIITGNSGHNVLVGGGGADRMVGGMGNDTYNVDTIGDTTIELNGQGIDSVYSSVSYFLWDQSQFIENLTLSGTAHISAGGNGLGNTLTGNSGNNVLNGGAGADRMVGGQGNDTYYVESAFDTTVELAGEGTDSIFSSVDYFLWDQSQHIETLTLTGAGNIDGGGNGLANTITGNSGNNILNGGGNADQMNGGQGNDTYIVDNAGDTTVELDGQGVDSVISSISFALRDQNQFLENLTLGGGGNTNGTGNGLANRIEGNSGNNTLNGAYGNDTLIGGGGNDSFNDDAGNDIFTGGAGIDTFFCLGAGESDRITDFQNGIDKMTIGLGVNSFSNITVTDAGANAILTFGSNTVTLENFDHALVSSDDFMFV